MSLDEDVVLHGKLEFMTYGRETRRFHGLPMLDYQRVDAHMWGVAMLCDLIVGPGASAARRLRLMQAAMIHDLAEHITGDMPAPTKRALPDYCDFCEGKKSFRDVFGDYEDKLMQEAGYVTLELESHDKRVLKLADAAEGCLHCIKERQLGNAHPRLVDCFYAFWGYCTADLGLDSASWHIDHNIHAEHGEKALRFFIRSAWEKANGGKW